MGALGACPGHIAVICWRIGAVRSDTQQFVFALVPPNPTARSSARIMAAKGQDFGSSGEAGTGARLVGQSYAAASAFELFARHQTGHFYKRVVRLCVHRQPVKRDEFRPGHLVGEATAHPLKDLVCGAAR